MAVSEAKRLTIPQSVYFMQRGTLEKKQLSRGEVRALGEKNAERYERERIEAINRARQAVGIDPHPVPE